MLTAAIVGAAALAVGATLAASSRPTAMPHGARAAEWRLACGERCELTTIAEDGAGAGHWVGLVYTSATDARVVTDLHRPLGAAVTFNDGRRFIFDLCRDDACRLPPADSAALLQRLHADATGTLRVHLASGGTTGLIDLPRLNGFADGPPAPPPALAGY